MDAQTIEKNIKNYFRSLDCRNYVQTYQQIPHIVDTMRMQARGQGKDVVFKVYGTLAEETAHLLLRMYQSQYESEIIESLIFEYESNQTTEIDLMFLTKNMIYIIECKHRSNNIELTSDGSFKIDGRIESPVNQNVRHIKKLFGNMSYGNLIPAHRIKNIVFLMFNGAQMVNPTTMFTKDNFNGAFAGYGNLLPLIHKFEQENQGGKIPIKTIRKDLGQLGRPYADKDGMKRHVENLNRKFNK